MANVISVVIPVCNEADSIKDLLIEVSRTLQDHSIAYEICVVDDGSNDATVPTVEHYALENPKVRLLRHRHNRGQSAGILTGIRAAEYGWIVTLDGDGQNDPKDIPVMLEAFNEHASDIVPLLLIGNRGLRQDNWLRRISSRVANRVRSTLLQDECLDSGCGLKIFRKEDILHLPLFDHFHRFLPALFTGAGGRVMNIPVRHRPRMRGVSKYGVMNRLWVGVVDILGVLWLKRRNRCWTIK